jgi:hypothetical protein
LYCSLDTQLGLSGHIDSLPATSPGGLPDLDNAASTTSSNRQAAAKRKTVIKAVFNTNGVLFNAG